MNSQPNYSKRPPAQVPFAAPVNNNFAQYLNQSSNPPPANTAYNNTPPPYGQYPYATQGSFNPNPFTEASIASHPAAQLGLHFGNQALAAGQTLVNQNINRYFDLPSLKYYFNVDNLYVLKKVALVLFPFRHKVFFPLLTFRIGSEIAADQT